MDWTLFAATALAGFIYTITPGPAFLALFTLGAAKGRVAGGWFMIGHLVGDVVWSGLALAAIVGVSQLGPALFDTLGILCGLYLLWLGFKALTMKASTVRPVIGAERPLANGIFFGLTNPKSYPVALAMFGAIVAPYGDRITVGAIPVLFAGSFTGFVLADLVLFFWIGLGVVRRFFLRHGVWVTRIVGLTFMAFGAKSILDSARGFASRA
jgi:threonine/homoserine/homoserine lactone efflux protein